jgi:hypothetical protein
MKKSLILFSLLVLGFNAKAYIMVAYKSSADSLAPIQQANIKLVNSTLKDGVITDQNGLTLGQAKDAEKAKADKRGLENNNSK